ncbi:Spt20 family-domain-containing protein [Mycena metata]|uniref:Spt20 family-domain-containing protein n=1 Tax=Mycena metata TaxID=1033252 RepID=A0AAD7K331_9AGAR|nr:Spt20 family-domain-containing protein [Mycena metata]
MASYNRTRHAEDLLEKNASQPPSFSVHLHPEHWTLNNVSKFLYNTQISVWSRHYGSPTLLICDQGLLDDIRAHRIPVDFLELFDAAKIPFYDGCMIVELLDYRPQQRNKETAPDKPERTRVVLHPNGETLFADICSLNRKNGNKWSDRDALAIEARLLLATSPPLCLTPDPHLTRVVNHVLRVSTPTVPISLKRKAAAMDPEEDEVEKARRTKIMQFMTPRPGRTHNQNYRILEAIQRARQPRDANTKPPTPSAPAQEPVPPSSMGTYPPASVEKLRKQNRPGTPKIPSNGSTHTSANQTPSPTHMYANMQSVPPSADSKRAPTPLQHQYPPSSSSVPPPQSQPHPPNPNPNPPQPRPPSAVPTFQPPIPNAQFLNPPPAGRNPNGQAKAIHPNNKPPQPNGQQAANAMYYAQQHQALIMQQRMAAQQQQQQAQQAQQGTPQQQQPPQQNGRSTPRPGMNNAQANAVAAMAASRGSPLAPNQRIATRSPANQNPGQPPNPQMAAHNHPPSQLNFSYHTPPHLRPNAANGNAPSPRSQALPPHLAATQQRASPSPGPSGNPAPPAAEGGQPGGGMPPQQPQQPPQAQQYQMYYPNVFMQSGGGRMPNGYPVNGGWPMMVPGRAGANGHGPGMPMSMPMQPIMPGGQQHPLQHHQVPVGGGGKGQPGLPGR